MNQSDSAWGAATTWVCNCSDVEMKFGLFLALPWLHGDESHTLRPSDVKLVCEEKAVGFIPYHGCNSALAILDSPSPRYWIKIECCSLREGCGTATTT